MSRAYGELNLTATSPPQGFTELFTVDQVRAFLRIESPSPQDSEEEAMLTSFIAAARQQAEIQQGRDIVEKQYDLTLDYFPSGDVELRHPLQSVDLVTYKDSDDVTTTLTENTDYIVDTVRALVMPPYGGTWPSFTPWPSGAVTVRFTSGDGAASEDVMNGMKFLIAHWHCHPESFELGANAVQEFPFTVSALLRSGARDKVG